MAKKIAVMFVTVFVFRRLEGRFTLAADPYMYNVLSAKAGFNFICIILKCEMLWDSVLKKRSYGPQSKGTYLIHGKSKSEKK